MKQAWRPSLASPPFAVVQTRYFAEDYLEDSRYCPVFVTRRYSKSTFL
jgi:hypothetical protein